MNKKIVLTAVLSLAVFAHTDANTIGNFHSYNKPLSPEMASYKTMMNYRHDVDQYLEKIDDEIEALLEKKIETKAMFNKDARAFNGNDFFHKETVPLYEKERHNWKHYFEKDDADDDTIIIIKDLAKQKRDEKKITREKQSDFEKLLNAFLYQTNL